jgi:transmembrane sensor
MDPAIYNLLAKHFSGQANEDENATVKKWMETSAANEADYRLLEKLWHSSAAQEPIQFDTEKALHTVTAQIDASETNTKKARLVTLQRAVAVAAMLVISFAIWWFAAHYSSSHIVQAIADMETVQLQDGSKVYLRKGAVLHYPGRFKGSQRTITLTGEAFFDIAPDKSKPFIIAARETEVQVVGTSFSVIAGKDSVEVIVKTGKVAFHSKHNKDLQVLLSPGERALYSHEQLTKAINTDENFNAWQSKQLVFRNTPMANVVATLSDHYKARIDCRNIDLAELSQTTVTVTFKNQTLASVLQELSMITPYETRQIARDHFELRKK